MTNSLEFFLLIVVTYHCIDGFDGSGGGDCGINRSKVLYKVFTTKIRDRIEYET